MGSGMDGALNRRCLGLLPAGCISFHSVWLSREPVNNLLVN